jgi:hypothetical protein
VAKRTPDYTKQVRHEKPRKPVSRPGRATAARGRRAEAKVPPAPKALVLITYASLAGGVALYLYVLYLAHPTAGGLVAVGCGLITDGLVAVLAAYALDPVKHPLRRVNKRALIFVLVIFAAVTVMLTVSVPLLSPGLIPPIAVFFYMIRPRLKLIAEVEGTYRPTRRDQALEEIQERRAERKREKEREAAMKRTIKQRLQRGAGPVARTETETEDDEPASAAADARARRPAKRRGGRR